MELAQPRKIGPGVDDRQRQRRRAQIEARDARAVVGIADYAVNTWIADRDRHVKSRDRPVGIDQHVEVADAAIDVAEVHRKIRHELMLEEGRDLTRVLLFEIRIEDRAAKPAALADEGSFLTRVPQTVAVGIGPRELSIPVRGIFVDVLGDLRAGVPPECPVVELQDRLTRPGQVIHDADARRERVEGLKVVDRGELELRPAVELAGRRAFLFGLERRVLVVAQADIEGHAPGLEGVLQKQPIGQQAVLRSGRRLEQVDLRRDAVVENVEHIARHRAPVVGATNKRERLAEELAAELEVVGAAHAFLEVAHRTEYLVS